MCDVFLKIFNMSYAACYIILAAIIFRIAFKKAPKWSNILIWGLAGVRLICPFSFKSILSLIPSAEPLPQNIMMSPTPKIDTGIPIINQTVNSVVSESITPGIGTSVNPMQIFVLIATAVWVIGMATMLIYGAFSYLKLRFRVRASILYKDNIYICDSLKTPFILGVVKAKIFIPSNLSQKECDFVLAHEKSHLKHFDHLIKPFGFLVLMLHWFNPLVWVAYNLLCKDIELACDGRVVKEMNLEDKKEYSNTLLELSMPRRFRFAHPLAFGEVGVKSRIKSVLNFKKPALPIVIIAVIIALVIGAVFLTDPLSTGEEYKKPKNSTNAPDNSVLAYIEDIDIENENITICIYSGPSYEVSFGEDFNIYKIKNGRKISCFTLAERFIHSILHLKNKGGSDSFTFSTYGFDISDYGTYLFELDFNLNDNKKDKYKMSLEFNMMKGNGTVIETNDIAYNAVLGGNNAAKPVFKIQDGKLYKGADKNYQGFDFDYPYKAPNFSKSDNCFWVDYGTMEETTLNKENFDQLFNESYWVLKYSPAGFRAEAKKSWVAKNSDYEISDLFSPYTIVMELQDGRYLFATGTYGLEFPENLTINYLYLSKSPETAKPHLKDDENKNSSFTATVLEVEPSLLVRPDDDTDEIKSCSKIYVSTNLISANPLPDIKVGDKIKIVYNGEILESYPAQIINVFSVQKAE